MSWSLMVYGTSIGCDRYQEYRGISGDRTRFRGNTSHQIGDHVDTREKGMNTRKGTSNDREPPFQFSDPHMTMREIRSEIYHFSTKETKKNKFNPYNFTAQWCVCVCVCVLLLLPLCVCVCCSYCSCSCCSSIWPSMTWSSRTCSAMSRYQ